MNNNKTQPSSALEFKGTMLAHDIPRITEETELDSEPRERPKALYGETHMIDTGYGDLRVTINLDENGDPYEVFCELGKSGSLVQSDTEAIGRLISLAFRHGIPLQPIIDQLDGIKADKIAWDNSDKISSIADGVAKALERHKARREGEEIEKVDAKEAAKENGDDVEFIDEVCSECGSIEVMVSEGCKTCQSCGWSECG